MGHLYRLSAIAAVLAAAPSLGAAYAQTYPFPGPRYDKATRAAITTTETPTDGPATTTIATRVNPAAGETTPIHAVFLRAGPSTDAPIIGTLQRGTTLQVVASGNYGWMQVNSPAGTGWTFGSYLAPGAGAGLTAVASGSTTRTEIIMP